MKRLFAILLILAMLLGGCQGVEQQETAAPDTAVEGTEQKDPDLDTEKGDSEKAPQEDQGASQTEQKPSDKDQKEENDEKEEQPSQGDEQKEPDPSQKPSDGQQEKDPLSKVPADAYAQNYKGPEGRNFRAVIYKARVYYECDPYAREPWQPHIYTVSLDNKKEPEDYFKGELIGLYGSVLLAKSATHYHARDLSDQKGSWITLQSAATTGAVLEWGDKVLLFSTLKGQHYVDTVDLDALTAKREKIDQLPAQCSMVKNLLYYTVETPTDQTLVYQVNMTNKKSKLLGTYEGLWDLYEAEGCIFLYLPDSNVAPMVYNSAKGKLEALAGRELTHAQNITLRGILGGVVYMEYYYMDNENKVFEWRVWNYDLVNLKDVSKERTIPRDMKILPNGYYRYNKENNRFECTIDGKSHYVELEKETYNESTVIVMERTGVAFLHERMISVGNFAAKKTQMYYHTWQDVTKE